MTIWNISALLINPISRIQSVDRANPVIATLKGPKRSASAPGMKPKSGTAVRARRMAPARSAFQEKARDTKIGSVASKEVTRVALTKTP